jgi:hypothetical protein
LDEDRGCSADDRQPQKAAHLNIANAARSDSRSRIDDRAAADEPPPPRKETLRFARRTLECTTDLVDEPPPPREETLRFARRTLE